MIDEPSARVAPESDIDYRLLIPFLAHVTLLQTLILIVRITTSYRALELGLPVVWLGIIPPASPLSLSSRPCRWDAGSTAVTTPGRPGSARRWCSSPASA